MCGWCPGVNDPLHSSWQMRGTRAVDPLRYAVWRVHGCSQCVCPCARYDVFLGNNRGNKYSSKHTSLNYRDKRYWDFSIDELARFDVPAMVNVGGGGGATVARSHRSSHVAVAQYILHATGQRQCAIIGFSQGTAQTFAALSQDHLLTSKVSAFVALSPAVAVKGASCGIVRQQGCRAHVCVGGVALQDCPGRRWLLSYRRTKILSTSCLGGGTLPPTCRLHAYVQALTAASLLCVLLRRRIFPSTLVWQRILSTDFYVRVIDASLRYLFNWDVANVRWVVAAGTRLL